MLDSVKIRSRPNGELFLDIKEQNHPLYFESIWLETTDEAYALLKVLIEFIKLKEESKSDD